MTTAPPPDSAVAITLLAERDRERADALVDRCMRPGAALSMTADFPLLVGPGARSERLVAISGERIVAHVAGRIARIDRPGCSPLRILNVGAVATAPEARGRGLAGALVRTLLERARRRGIELAMLWTDRPAFYERIGFAFAGCERRVLYQRSAVSAGAFPSPSAFAVAPVRREDVGALLDLRLKHDPAPLSRARREAERLFFLPRSHGLVLRDGTDRIVAYAVLGKGLDFPDTVCEWGGGVEFLPILLDALLDRLRLAATAVLGPAHDAAFATFAETRVAQLAPVGMAAVVDASRLRAAFPGHLDRVPDDALAAAVLGTPDGTPGLLPFYVWGLDSM